MTKYFQYSSRGGMKTLFMIIEIVYTIQVGGKCYMICTSSRKGMKNRKDTYLRLLRTNPTVQIMKMKFIHKQERKGNILYLKIWRYQ